MVASPSFPRSRGAARLLVVSLPLGLIPAAGPAGEWDFSGSVSAELRVFPQDPAFRGQDDSAASASVAFEPELVYEWNGGADRLTLAPFLRLDTLDSNRSHADIRAASWLHVGDGWDLVVGVDKVFWGVAESRHLVDIVNQNDAVEDIDGEEKLGQPMVNLNLLGGWGKLALFALPGFRERPFPADDARLRGSLPIASGRATYDSGAGDDGLDFAMRYSTVFGDWDVGLSHFHGTSREPRLIPGAGPDGPVFIPHYDLIDQTGLDLQYTTGAWLWKLETMTRSGHGDRFFAAVGGFEYTLFGIADSGTDLGLLAEYSHDGRDRVQAPPTIHENDVFLGARLALNDIDDTSALIGGLVDVKTGSVGLSVEAERRLGEDWRVGLEARLFVNVAEDDTLAAFRRDGFLSLTLSRYF